MALAGNSRVSSSTQPSVWEELADVAKYQFNIEPSNENTGQTFSHYGAEPGPYLVLPFLSPLTVRNAVGYAFDLALDPINYVLPIVGTFGGPQMKG